MKKNMLLIAGLTLLLFAWTNTALAADKIGRGIPVILDASFRCRADRTMAVDMARRLGVPFYVVECACPDDVVKIRLEKRMRDPDNPSDGRWEILQEQKKQYEAVTEIPESRLFQIDTSDNPETVRRQIVSSIKMAELRGMSPK